MSEWNFEGGAALLAEESFDAEARQVHAEPAYTLRVFLAEVAHAAAFWSFAWSRAMQTRRSARQLVTVGAK